MEKIGLILNWVKRIYVFLRIVWRFRNGSEGARRVTIQDALNVIKEVSMNNKIHAFIKDYLGRL